MVTFRRLARHRRPSTMKMTLRQLSKRHYKHRSDDIEATIIQAIRRFMGPVVAIVTMFMAVQVLAAEPSLVSVQSEPSGRPFELVGPPKSPLFRGVTPAIFHDVPPVYYTVQFDDVGDGCSAPKPQKREVQDNNIITFYGVYNCPEPAEPVMEMHYEIEQDTRGQVSVSLQPHQSESVAGSTVFYTLRVKNHSRRTQHDIEVSMQHDPAKLAIGTLPKGGVREGNLALWTIPQIYAGQTWTVTFPVVISEAVAQGEQLDATARVTGREIVASISELTSETTVGAVVLPATGERYDWLFALLSAYATLLLTFLNRRRRHLALTVS